MEAIFSAILVIFLIIVTLSMFLPVGPMLEDLTSWMTTKLANRVARRNVKKVK